MAGSVAFDINDSGIAVGSASGLAVLWKANGVAVDLNTLIDPVHWSLGWAIGISNTGWISGIGKYDPDGPDPPYDRFFLLKLSDTLPGDYNADSHVDAADYTTWRDGLGTIFALNDYNVWRAKFGMTSGVGGAAATSTSVPEAASIWLVVAALFGICATTGRSSIN